MRSRVLAFVTCIALCVMVACGCAADSEESTDEGSSAIWNGPNRFGLDVAGARSLDLGNAYWMARVSSMVYGSREDIVRDLAAVGVNDAEVIFFENVATSTQAAYIGLADAGILVFRGTWEITDFFVDAIALRRNTRVGDVHTGFDVALLSVWNDSPGVKANGVRGEGIAKHLRRRHWRSGPNAEPKPLFFAGHSLGGALASLASVYSHWDGCLAQKPASDPMWAARRNNLGLHPPCEEGRIEVSALYTFGAPRVGGRDHAVMMPFSEEPNLYWTSLFRFVHANDLVTSVPDEGYFHATTGRNERGGLIYLTRGGSVDTGGRSAEYLSWGWRTKVLERLGDHGVENYARKLLSYAGGPPPPPRLTPGRARNERIKAAFLAPGDPPLAAVTRDQLPSAKLKGELDKPATNRGTKAAFSWRFEGKTIYMFEERYPVESTDGRVLRGRSIAFFDADGTGLLSASSWGDDVDADVSFVWFDWNDASSSR